MTDPSARDREVARDLYAAAKVAFMLAGPSGEKDVEHRIAHALAAARAEGAKAERGVCEGELRAISALIDYWHFARPDDATRRHHDCSCHMCADLVRWLKASGMVRTPTPDDLPAWSFARRVNKRAHGGEADHDEA